MKTFGVLLGLTLPVLLHFILPRTAWSWQESIKSVQEGPYRCKPSTASLFRRTHSGPVDLTIRADFSRVLNRDLQPEEAEKTRVEAAISYNFPGEPRVEARVSLRARGGSRFEDCSFRPLLMEIDEAEKMRLDKEYGEHLFSDLGHDLKLALVCHNHLERRRSLLKEYLVYKIFGLLRSTTLDAALLRLTLESIPSPLTCEGNQDAETKSKALSLGATGQVLLSSGWAFFREPLGRLAERCGLEKEDAFVRQRYNPEERRFSWVTLKSPEALPMTDPERKLYLRNPDNWMPYVALSDQGSLFQMELLNHWIGNADYLLPHRHNIRVLTNHLVGGLGHTDQKTVRAFYVPYDFDITPVVDGGIFSFSKSPLAAAQSFRQWLSDYAGSSREFKVFINELLDLHKPLEQEVHNSPLDLEGQKKFLEWFELHRREMAEFVR